jgi:hypothetical protein
METDSMKTWNQLLTTLQRWLVFGCLCAFLAACANAGLVFHSFSFDIRESPGIEILDYKYGETKQSRGRASDADKQDGKVSQVVAIGGDMLLGDDLYVKWKIKSNGRIYEDLVNLKSLLPRDMNHHKIHFTVKGRQLFVYLITPERRPPDMPPNGPRQYDFLKVITLSSNYGREVSNEQ